MSKHISNQQIKELLKQELDQNKQKSSDDVSLAELCKKFTESRLNRSQSIMNLNQYQLTSVQ